MKIAFFGTPEIAAGVLRTLIDSEHAVMLAVTQPDKPAGRKHILTPSAVKKTAAENAIPVLQPKKCSEKEFLEKYRSFDIDINLIIAYGQILPDELIYHPEYDSINIHASLLPKYRGASPINHAIINGDRETGVTYQFIEKRLDAGDIIHSEKIPISEDDDAAVLYEKLKELSEHSVLKVLSMLQTGNYTRRKQDESAASYVSVLKKEDGRIDFYVPAHTLNRKIKGLLPWPCAFCSFEGHTLKILKAEPYGPSAPQSEPGTITGTEKHKGFKVNTADGELLITQLQPEGKKAMNAYDFTLGHPGITGKKLT
ncbi:MAG: methionyl-tRNA formyltransferase [Candidatus Goldiibacteriota bacterium]